MKIYDTGWGGAERWFLSEFELQSYEARDIGRGGLQISRKELFQPVERKRCPAFCGISEF
jgi:hypothetical protein